MIIWHHTILWKKKEDIAEEKDSIKIIGTAMIDDTVIGISVNDILGKLEDGSLSY